MDVESIRDKALRISSGRGAGSPAAILEMEQTALVAELLIEQRRTNALLQELLGALRQQV